MLMTFSCDKCCTDKWLVRYNTESKQHILSCVQCGKQTIIEDVFNKRRGNKNGRARSVNQQSKPVINEQQPATTDTQTGAVGESQSDVK